MLDSTGRTRRKLFGGCLPNLSRPPASIKGRPSVCSVTNMDTATQDGGQEQIRPRDSPDDIAVIQCGDSTIRQVLVDGKHYLSIKDAIKFICDTNGKRACVVWRTLPPGFKEELKEHLNTFNFPGSGGEMRDVITFHGLRELVMMLPGPAAKRSRLGYVRVSGAVVDRVLEGDESLHQEIDRNKHKGVTRARAEFLGQVLDAINKLSASQALLDAQKEGWIYATESGAFPGLLKIGKTSHLKERLSNMNTSCAPLPYRYVAVVPSFDVHRDKCFAHGYFNSKRNEGEFFQVTVEDVRAFFDNHIMPQYREELLENAPHM